MTDLDRAGLGLRFADRDLVAARHLDRLQLIDGHFHRLVDPLRHPAAHGLHRLRGTAGIAGIANRRRPVFPMPLVNAPRLRLLDRHAPCLATRALAGFAGRHPNSALLRLVGPDRNANRVVARHRLERRHLDLAGLGHFPCHGNGLAIGLHPLLLVGNQNRVGAGNRLRNGHHSQHTTLRVWVSGTHTVSRHVRSSVTSSGTQTVLVTHGWPQGAAGAAAVHPQSPPWAVPPSETPRTIASAETNLVHLILISSLPMGPNQVRPGNPVHISYPIST